MFVPYTLLSQDELDEQKTKMIEERGYDEATADELVRRIPELHLKFTEESIRRAFPAIEPGDTRKSLCRNSMMSDSTALVYLSPKPDQSVTVKHSNCYPTDGGLLCPPLSEHGSYYFESPEIHFTLSDDVTIEETNVIIEESGDTPPALVLDAEPEGMCI